MNSSPLARSEDAAVSAPESEPGNAVLPCQKAERFAIEVVVEGQDHRPVRGVPIRLSRSEREVCDDLSSPAGGVRYDGLERRAYFLTCPSLDIDAWQLVREEPLPGASSSGDLIWGVPPALEDPRPYRVEPGDCVAKIAFELGYAQNTIWDFGPNESLRSKRRSKFILQPGDTLQIPPKRLKQIEVQAGKRYLLRLADIPEILRVRFVTFSLRARANAPYLFHVETASGTVIPDRKGSTDGEGLLSEFIPPDAIHAEVWFGTGQFRETYPIDLGRACPLDSTVGVQNRLHNLSYLDSANCVPGELDEFTVAALRRFQADNQLLVTGEPDKATIAKLEGVHLS